MGRQSLPTTCLEVLKGMEASQVQTDVPLLKGLKGRLTSFGFPRDAVKR